MTDDLENNLDDDPRVVALERAISAAENALQAVATLWEMLTIDEQCEWLLCATLVTPRLDVALKTLLPAADKVLTELRAVDS